jgi:hypothetical protein
MNLYSTSVCPLPPLQQEDTCRLSKDQEVHNPGQVPRHWRASPWKGGVSSARPVAFEHAGSEVLLAFQMLFIVSVVVVHQFQFRIRYGSVVVQDGADQVQS